MTLKLRDHVLTAETEYGIALLDEDGDQYWTLNPSAAVVVQTLQEGGTPADAARALTERYGVDLHSASQDVQELIHDLRSAGLVEQDTERRLGQRRVRTWRRGKRAR